MKEKKEYLLKRVPDCLSDLFYYDRKECEEVSRLDVETMFKNGDITAKEVKKAFCEAIDVCFEEN